MKSFTMHQPQSIADSEENQGKEREENEEKEENGEEEEEEEEEEEIECWIAHYSYHDDGFLSLLGNRCHEKNWMVESETEEPFDIKLQIERQLIGATKVGIFCNGAKIYPLAGPNTKLLHDFEQEWPFRTLAKNIGVEDVYEVRAIYVRDYNPDAWLPCTLLSQKPHGYFEVCVVMKVFEKLHHNFLEVVVPAVEMSDIREAETQKPLEVEERMLVLKVPADNPLEGASLTVDGNIPLIQQYARPSPPPESRTEDNSSVTLQVSRNRKVIGASIGPTEFKCFLDGETFALGLNPERSRMFSWWEIQVGPYAKHRIHVERKSKLSRITTLTVDGEILAETTGDDLKCSGGSWYVDFELFGELEINYNIFQTNRDGLALDIQKLVNRKHKFKNKCRVFLQDVRDMREAEFYVNGTEFMELPEPPHHMEPVLAMTTQMFEAQYGLTIPWSTNYEAPAGPLMLLEKPSSLFKMFTCCTVPNIMIEEKEYSLEAEG